MNADLAPRHHCPACGEAVVHATWPDGTPAVLDPRPRCATVLVRSRMEIAIWPTTECMVEHTAVCRAGMIRRTLGGASVTREDLDSSGKEEMAAPEAARGDEVAAVSPS